MLEREGEVAGELAAQPYCRNEFARRDQSRLGPRKAANLRRSVAPAGPGSSTQSGPRRRSPRGQSDPIRRCRGARRCPSRGRCECGIARPEPGAVRLSGWRRCRAAGPAPRVVWSRIFISSRTVSFAGSPQAVLSARSQVSRSLWLALTRNLLLARKCSDAHAWQRRMTSGG